MRPKWFTTSVAHLERLVATCKHEGFMVRDPASGRVICKWKSPHYLNVKLLARGTFFLREDFDRRNLRQSVEEEAYPLIDYIFDEVGVVAFKALSPEQRVKLLQARLGSSPP